MSNRENPRKYWRCNYCTRLQTSLISETLIYLPPFRPIVFDNFTCHDMTVLKKGGIHVCM